MRRSPLRRRTGRACPDSQERGWLMVSPWWRVWLKRSWRGPRSRTRRAWHHLRLELLENRITPNAVNWIGGSGDWNNGPNWDNGTGPGPGDDAVINVAGIIVTHSSGTNTINSLAAADPINLSGGSLSVGGTLNVPGDFSDS